MPNLPPDRLLLITWNYPPKVGGMENLLYQLIQKIRSEIQVDVIAPFSEMKIPSVENVSVIRPQLKSLIWFFVFSLYQGLKSVRSSNHDVIFGGSVLVSPIIYLVGKLSHKPTVVYAHGLDLIFKNPIYQRVIQTILPYLDLVITNSSQTKRIAINKGVPAEDITIIHPGINTRDYEPSQDPGALKGAYDLENHKVLLYVGRLAKRKGVKEFIKYSLAEIIERHENLIFCVVGGDPEDSLTHQGSMSDEIRQEAENQGISDHVRLFGWVDREVLLDLFSLCDVFVLPAIHVPGDMEGFGIVLAEANAAGKPVVSSKIGGIPDAVQDGKSAILVEPEDWKAFTQAVLQLLGDEELRNEMGTKGREYVREELDWQVIEEKFLSAVRTI